MKAFLFLRVSQLSAKKRKLFALRKSLDLVTLVYGLAFVAMALVMYFSAFGYSHESLGRYNVKEIQESISLLLGFVFVMLTYKHLTNGIILSPIYFSAADTNLLFNTPISRKVIFVFEFLKTYLFRFLISTVVVILLLPVIRIIWGLSNQHVLLFALEIFFFLIFLVNLQFLVFSLDSLKRAMRIFKKVTLALFVAVVLLVLYYQAKSPNLLFKVTNFLKLDYISSLLMPVSRFGKYFFVEIGSLYIMLSLTSVLALLTFVLSLRRADTIDLERIVRQSLLVEKVKKLYKQKRLDELKTVSEELKGRRQKFGRGRIPIYIPGAFAIVWKSATLHLRQPIVVWLLRLSFLVGIFYVVVSVKNTLLTLVLALFFLFSLANQFQDSLRTDLAHSVYLRLFPFRKEEILRAHLIVPTFLLSCFGWLLLLMLWFRFNSGFYMWILSFIIVPVSAYILVLIAQANMIFSLAHGSLSASLIGTALPFVSMGLLISVLWLLLSVGAQPLHFFLLISFLAFLLGFAMRRFTLGSFEVWLRDEL